MSAENVEKKSVHPQYAELLCDFMFKRLFGSEANKDVLMGFLNMILKDVQIKDVKFISYAVWWIRQSIQKALFEQVGSVRIPPNKLALVTKFKRALMQNNGDYDKTMSLPEFNQYERDIVEVMEKIVDISLDAPIGEDGIAGGDSVSTLMDVLGTEGNQETELEDEERRKLLHDTLKDLPPREDEILRMFYGLDAVEDTTLRDIGEDLKLSRERVRQIKNKTLRKLQKSKELKEKFMDSLRG